MGEVTAVMERERMPGKSTQALTDAATGSRFTALGPLRNHHTAISAGHSNSDTPCPEHTGGQLFLDWWNSGIPTRKVERELILAHVTKTITGDALPCHTDNPFRSTPVAHLPVHPTTGERVLSAEYATRTLQTEQARMLDSTIPSMISKNEELRNIFARDVQSRMAPLLAQSSDQSPPKSNRYAGYSKSACLQGERQRVLPTGCNPPLTQLSHSEEQRNVRATHYGSGRRVVVMSKEEEREFAAYLFLKRRGF